MEDREFFDLIYQQWTKTTGAEDCYWSVEPHFDNSGRHNIYSVDNDDGRKLIASGLNEKDADWITGLHGCFADLYRRLHYALDEADRADFDRDSRECRIMELECEVAAKNSIIEGLSKEPPWTSRVP